MFSVKAIKTIFGSLVSFFSSVTGIGSLAKTPYIGRTKEVHWNYSRNAGSDLLDLVNDYVFYSNKGNNTKSFEKKFQAISKYADTPYFLPWDDVNDKKYQFLFNLDYNDDLDGFNGNYTKKTSKISSEFMGLVHAYEWYSAGIKKYREKLRSAQSTNMSNEDIEYTKKLIIIMHQERMMIADSLIEKIKNDWYCRNYIDLDFYTKSFEWNEKAREVADIIEQMKEPEKNTKMAERLLSIFADGDVKSEVAKFWNKRELENMLNQNKEKIEASHEQEHKILKKFLKELSLLTPLAPKEEEKKEKPYFKKYKSNSARRYDLEVDDGSSIEQPDTCCAKKSSPQELGETCKGSEKAGIAAPESEDPDDIEILHNI